MADLILVVDNDRAVCSVLAFYLQGAGYATATASDGLEGLRAFYRDKPDLVVLDLGLPRLDGWSMYQRVREVADVPVMVLSAHDEAATRLRAFQLGMDDFVPKPFNASEVVARVGAILARTRRQPPGTQRRVVSGDLVVDLETRQVKLAGHAVQLTPTEFRLLAVLAERPNRVFAPEELLERVWGAGHTAGTDNVKRYVHYLRAKLEVDPGNPRLVLNQRGFGYSLAEAAAGDGGEAPTTGTTRATGATGDADRPLIRTK